MPRFGGNCCAESRHNRVKIQQRIVIFRINETCS